MANTPIYNMTDTWNAGGTTFNAIKMDVTDTASAAGSKLLDLLVGGASKFSVSKAGNVAAAGTLTVTGASTLAALGATNGTFSGTLGVTGAATLSSTLAVTGNTTLSGTLNNLQFLRWNPSSTNFDSIAIRSGATNDLSAVARQSILIGHLVGASISNEGVNPCENTVLIGNRAGQSLQTGGSNVAIGASSLNALTTGNSNTAIGTLAGQLITSGSSNLFIGRFAGNQQTEGDSNIIIGVSRQADSLTGSHQINIGDRYFHNRIQLREASAGAGDCVIRREAADALALRRATSPQALRVYNTYTDDSNYERGYLDWSSNVMRLGTQKLGSGTARALELQTNGTTAVKLTTAQKAEFAATIKTAAPSGGTAAEWKLGTVASVSPTSPDRTIEVEIGGTTYYLAAKTTND